MKILYIIKDIGANKLSKSIQENNENHGKYLSKTLKDIIDVQLKDGNEICIAILYEVLNNNNQHNILKEERLFKKISENNIYLIKFINEKKNYSQINYDELVKLVFFYDKVICF